VLGVIDERRMKGYLKLDKCEVHDMLQGFVIGVYSIKIEMEL